MPLNNPMAGAASAADYTVSGLPYVTASTALFNTVTEIRFDYVSSFFSVRNKAGGGDLAVGFTRNGVTGSYRTVLATGEVFSADMRVKSLFLLSLTGSVAYEIAAGLTTILANNFPILTGSSGSWNGVG